MVGTDCGIVYIATGDQYRDEAILSAQSVKSQMPEVDITLVTDAANADDIFDGVVTLENPRQDFGDKVQGMPLSPYERTIYLDTDTYVAEPLTDLFEILDQFDVAAASNKAFMSSEFLNERGSFLDAVPPSFPEYNSGVVAYRDNDITERFFKTWQREYEKALELDEVEDQGSFRKGLYETDVRIATLPRRYNCIFRRAGCVNGTIKIFHSRLIDIERVYHDAGAGAAKRANIEQVVAELNSTDELRLYHPIGERVKLVRRSPLKRLLYSIQDRGLVTTLRLVYELYCSPNST